MVRSSILLALFALSATFFLAGCGDQTVDDPWPSPRALGSHYRSYRPPERFVKETPGAVAPLGETVSLDEAIALALARHPGLMAAAWGVRAGEARADQDGSSPNPEVRVRYSDFAGSGRFSGADEAQQELRITQDLELAGKAGKRRRIAQLEARLAGWDYETRRLDLVAEVSSAFALATAAEQRLEIARKAHEALQRVLSSLADGAISPIEAARRRLEQAESGVALDRANRGVEVALQNLAATWGAEAGDLPPLAPLSDEAPELPSLDDLLTKVIETPEVARWETDAHLRQAGEDLAEARRVPDLELLGEISREDESGDHGFSVGVSVDVPLFDRNAGAVREARFLRLRASHEKALAAGRARAALREAYSAAANARAEMLALKEVLPVAESAFGIAEDTFLRGALSYQDYLRAHRTLSRARTANIDALEAYRLAVIEIERAMAAPLHP
jgi:outer membrane protein, heavy metal efflux system